MSIRYALLSLILIAPLVVAGESRETTLTDSYGPAVGVDNPVGTAAAQSASFTAPHKSVAVIVNLTDDLSPETYFTVCINKNVANPASARNCTRSDGDIDASGINSVTLNTEIAEAQEVLIFVFANHVGDDLSVAIGTNGEIKATFMKPAPPAL